MCATPAARLIKKYSNRRLYDTQSSAHVTLDDLRKVILEGENVCVVDEKTGADITHTTLLQIIMEYLQNKQYSSSSMLSLLHGIVRFENHPLEKVLCDYLDKCMESFLRQQGEWREQLMRTTDEIAESIAANFENNGTEN